MVTCKSVLLLAAMLSLAACNPEKAGSNDSKASSSPPTTAAVAAVVSKPVVYDGPFGLRMGMSADQVRAATKGFQANSEAPLSYTADSVPTPHGSFEGYFFLISESAGLCAINAIGRNIESASNGSEVRSEFDALAEAITKKYGGGKKVDYVTGIADDPQFWMMSLQDKDRVLAMFWDREEKSNLPADLESISLSAKGADIRTAYLVLRYDFKNFDVCAKEAKEVQNKGL